jgi:uroporphyrinogen decarboxylase
MIYLKNFCERREVTIVIKSVGFFHRFDSTNSHGFNILAGGKIERRKGSYPMNESMSKKGRFQAAIHGEEVDHLPVSVWLHLASEHLPGVEAARLHLAYYRAYDWDYLKVMHDYRYPLPDGLAEIRTGQELERLTPQDLRAVSFKNQLELYAALLPVLGDEVPLIETLFDPLQTLVRAGGASIRQVIFDSPSAGHQALEAVTQSLVAYIQELKAREVDGLFYSINGAVQPGAGGLSEERWREFVDPYNRRILRAAEGMVRIAHIHGFELAIERVLDYPVEAWSWSHHNSAPSLAEMRKLTSACLFGGINEVEIAHQTDSELAADIARAASEAGTRKLVIGPGCTVPPDTAQHLLLAARQAAHEIQ